MGDERWAARRGEDAGKGASDLKRGRSTRVWCADSVRPRAHLAFRASTGAVPHAASETRRSSLHVETISHASPSASESAAALTGTFGPRARGIGSRAGGSEQKQSRLFVRRVRRMTCRIETRLAARADGARAAGRRSARLERGPRSSRARALARDGMRRVHGERRRVRAVDRAERPVVVLVVDGRSRLRRGVRVDVEEEGPVAAGGEARGRRAVLRRVR